jgi:rSAM/selenodomain-associated transferase 1
MSLRGATPKKPEPALIVFARAPEPGRVKTRLVPLLGKRGAARLHARLVEKTLETALAAEFGDIDLYCSPGIGHGFFLKSKKRFGVGLRSQGGGDLGDRMYRAFKRALGSHSHVVLIGSDCPVLRPADLRAAERALRAGADAVLSPAEDGGYALIGLRRVSRRLFDGIAWSTPEVLAQTRGRLAQLRWRWKELRTVWDVDRPQDVARLEKLRSRRPSATVRRRVRP